MEQFLMPEAEIIRFGQNDLISASGAGGVFYACDSDDDGEPSAPGTVPTEHEKLD